MRRMRSIGTLAALMVATAACSTDSAMGVDVADPQVNLDVARVAGEASAQDVEVMRGLAPGRFAFGLLWRPREFDCDREVRSRLTVTRTCVFKDAAGNVQARYSPVTTASVNVKVSIKGDITREHWSATVDRSSDLTVSGLAGDETQSTWNGTFGTHRTRARITDDGTTRTYDFLESGTVVNVVIPFPRDWPRSGTITKSVKVTKPNGRVVERTVSITFNGTSIVKVTVNGEAFDFDLSERGRPHRHDD